MTRFVFVGIVHIAVKGSIRGHEALLPTAPRSPQPGTANWFHCQWPSTPASAKLLVRASCPMWSVTTSSSSYSSFQRWPGMRVRPTIVVGVAIESTRRFHLVLLNIIHLLRIARYDSRRQSLLITTPAKLQTRCNPLSSLPFSPSRKLRARSLKPSTSAKFPNVLCNVSSQQRAPPQAVLRSQTPTVFARPELKMSSSR